MKQTKKLIEVSLPLPEINDASAYDKMPGIGPHPKGIHHWWARLPLPVARAVLFASTVDDPGEHPEKWPTEEAQKAERERLFDIIRRMMGKKLHEHPEIYAEARTEMLGQCGGSLPEVFDPFSGGGSIPLEANRLGFESHAGDLNPVAVLLNKCNLEFAPRWVGSPPVNPLDRGRIGGSDTWTGTHGLAADVRHYGRIVRAQARTRIGNLYPKARLPREHGGGEAEVIAWMWARTVASPDPAARGCHVPLVGTYILSGKKGNEAWLEPVVDKEARTYRFEVRHGPPKDRPAAAAGTKNGRGGFKCLLTNTPIPFDYIRNEGQHGKLRYVMLALVADLRRGRVFIAPTADQVEAASMAIPEGFPDTDLPEEALGFRVQNYGIKKHWQMFTPRQLAAMVTLSNLVQAVKADVLRDATTARLGNDAEEYARTVTIFLALALDRCASFNNSICRWNGNQTVFVFTRQAISMSWDFSEANIMGEKAVCWLTAVDICADAIETIAPNPTVKGYAHQIDAAGGTGETFRHLLVSTDPPYYDNIGYAALSDVFYVWLRRTVGDSLPGLFNTVLVPKLAELTASPELFRGEKEKAKEHFESGFRNAFTSLRGKLDPRFPLTIYYAFKQADEEAGVEEEESEVGVKVDLTTGWETLLEALVSSGFQVSATWPVRASFKWRVRALGANALASYIVLACRPRQSDAPRTDRRSFVAEMKRDLPLALRRLQQGNIAPVDFAQAALGPGMAIYSRYDRILETSGSAMTVRAALSLINQILTDVLSEQEDEFDADTRWAIAWFEQHGFDSGEFGEAELLSKAKVTAVAGLQQAGIIQSKGGKVRLLRPEELPADWDPKKDKRLTVWEIVHHLIRVYCCEQKGEDATAALLARIGAQGEVARDLAYRLHNLCEKKKRSEEAQTYNALGLGWPEIARIAREGRKGQTDMYEEK